jgi:hypothetical protein
MCCLVNVLTTELTFTPINQRAEANYFLGNGVLSVTS